MCIFLLQREWHVSRTPPPPPPVVIKHRTCDLSPVPLTNLNELNSVFKNNEPLQLPDHIHFFNWYFNAILLDNQSVHNCVRGIKTSFCSNTQFSVTSVGRSTVRIVNVLQIASKFYHLKIFKRRKKIDQRQNASLQSYLTMNSARHQSIRPRHAKLPINTTIVQNAILPPHFCKIGGGGEGIKTHSSVRLLVCLSVPLSVTKTLT